MAVTREKLYEELWAEPALTVAKRYGVSSSFLARVCDRLNVPTPPPGYWAKVAVGKKPHQPPLPEARTGDETEWLRPGEKPSSPPPDPKPPEADRPRTENARVPPDGRHPLLVGVRRHFDVDRVDRAGRVRPRKKLLVDVFVSKQTLGKALRTANALFLELERRGHHVVMAAHDNEFHRPSLVADRHHPRYDESWAPQRPTLVFVGTLAIGLTLFELTEEVNGRWFEGRWVKRRKGTEPPPQIPRVYDFETTRTLANGRLCLRASCPYRCATWERRWTEAEPGELLAKTAEVVSELEAEAPHIVTLVEEGKREAERRQKEWEEECEKRRREEEERRRQENFKASREELLAAIQGWGAARNIEDFFVAVEERAAVLPEEERARIMDRLARGRAMIGDVDPLRRLRAWRAPEERPGWPGT